MLRKPLCVALVTLLSTPFQLASADEMALASLTEGDFFDDIPIILTATRLKQPKKDSPVATTVIDREMIEASGFTEIADLLKLAPGMLVNYDSGHVANVGYQFLFDRYRVRLQVLIDGMSVYTPSFGEMPWTQLGITIDDIERIEVIRGPSSASYGPNAMTGVISIITRSPTLDSSGFKLNEGENGRSEQFVRYANSGSDFNYRLSLGARQDDGFEERYDGKDLMIATFRGDYQVTKNDVLTFSVNYNSGDYQEDSTPTLNDNMPEHTKSIEQTYLQGKWEHHFSNGDSFNLNFYQQNFDDDNSYVGDFTSDGFGIVPIDEGAKTERQNLEFSYTTSSDLYSLTAGALYRVDNTLSSQYLYNVDKDIETQQLFINTAFNLNESNVLNVGVLRDDNDTGGTTTSPRLALNHHLNNDHTFRVSYAESTRSPFALEEYTNRVIYIPLFDSDLTVWNDLSDLKPEQNKSFDIGYIGNLNNDTTVIDVRIYKSTISDVIVQDWSIGTGGFLQGDEFDINGIEFTITQNFENTKAILNYANTKITTDNLLYGDAIDYETGTPEHNTSLLLMHSFSKKMDAALGYYYTSSYQQLCCEVDQQDERKRLDFTFSKSFKIGKYNSKMKLVLQNITNNQVETRLFNNYDRQGYVSFSMEI